MTQWFSTLVALREDISEFPSTYMGAHNHLYLQFQGTLLCPKYKSPNTTMRLMMQKQRVFMVN